MLWSQAATCPHTSLLQEMSPLPLVSSYTCPPSWVLWALCARSGWTWPCLCRCVQWAERSELVRICFAAFLLWFKRGSLATPLPLAWCWVIMQVNARGLQCNFSLVGYKQALCPTSLLTLLGMALAGLGRVSVLSVQREHKFLQGWMKVWLCAAEQGEARGEHGWLFSIRRLPGPSPPGAAAPLLPSCCQPGRPPQVRDCGIRALCRDVSSLNGSRLYTAICCMWFKWERSVFPLSCLWLTWLHSTESVRCISCSLQPSLQSQRKCYRWQRQSYELTSTFWKHALCWQR